MLDTTGGDVTLTVNDGLIDQQRLSIYVKGNNTGFVLGTGIGTPSIVEGQMIVMSWNEDDTEWDLSKVDKKALLLQVIIFKDILNAKFLCFRTSEEMEKQLSSVGFKNIQFIKDEANMFPTIVAYK